MATPIKMGRVSKVATSAEVVEWLKTPGQSVRAGEPLVRVLSEKATIDLESPADGVLLEIVAPVNREASVGAILGWIGQAGEKAPTAGPAGAPAQKPDAPAAGSVSAPAQKSDAPASAGVRPLTTPASEAIVGAVKATPAARRIARERGVDLSRLAGKGSGGIITAADVEAVEARREVEKAAASAPAMPLEPGDRLEPLSGIQRAMLERMTLSLREVAQATTVAEVDVSEIMGLRGSVPATLTAWVMLAAVRALGEYPLLNASLRERELLYHGSVNVGVSVETSAGLLVPVIRDAGRMALGRLNAELERLTQAAREGKLTSEEMAGATFTVTNSGVLGSVLYTPMIVPPQSAILGMGRAAKTPVVRGDQIIVRTMMYLSLSYDHRFIAGGTAVRYLQRVRAFLESPATLVWDV